MLNKVYSLLIISSLFVGLIKTADCGSPLDCYNKAIAILTEDRLEMRHQMEKYEAMYNSAIKENENLRETIKQMENSFNSQISQINTNYETKLKEIRTYIDRPYTNIDILIYQSSSLRTNISLISLDGIVPKEAKKVLIYVSYYTGNTYEAHGNINLFTKVFGSQSKRYLKIDNYDQNSYNSNSSVFEFDLDGIDFNFYYYSDYDLNSTHFYLSFKVIGYK